MIAAAALVMGMLFVGIAPASAEWCSGLANYTDWHEGDGALFVYRGLGNPNPYAVAIRYNGSIVPDADYGVQTYTGPQGDLQNGWIVYHISTRWLITHPGWNDDWRWSVRACFR